MQGREGEEQRKGEGGEVLGRGTVRGSGLPFYQGPLESEKPQLLYLPVRSVTTTMNTLLFLRSMKVLR